MSNKKTEFYNRLVIAQTKIGSLMMEVVNGLDIETDEGQERVADRFNTILYNLEEAYDTVIFEEQVEEEEVARETLEEFIGKIVDMFDYEGAAKDVFRINVAGAIDRLKSRYGYCEFGGSINGEIATLTLRVDSETVVVTRGAESYVHYLLVEDVEEELEVEDEEDYEGEYDEDEGEDEESYQYEEDEGESCSCISCQLESMEDEDVHSEVNSILSLIDSDIEDLKETIENHLGTGTLGTASNLSEDDYDLIRTYLVHVVEADKYEVYQLSDRGLMAAWNHHLYIKNNQ